jgi:hypothetical protein
MLDLLNTRGDTTVKLEPNGNSITGEAIYVTTISETLTGFDP